MEIMEKAKRISEILNRDYTDEYLKLANDLSNDHYYVNEAAVWLQIHLNSTLKQSIKIAKLFA